MQTNNATEYVRNKEIDSIRYQELIVQLARQKEYICRTDVVSLLHISPAQAYIVRQKLTKSGILMLESKEPRQDTDFPKDKNTRKRTHACILIASLCVVLLC